MPHAASAAPASDADRSTSLRPHEHLVVRVGPERFALPLAEVEEAVDDLAVHVPPGLADGHLGYLAWRGGRVPLFCPGAALGHRAARPAAAALVLRGDGAPCAVAVDEVLDALDVPTGRLRALRGLRDPFAVVAGVVVEGGVVTTVVRPAALRAAVQAVP